MSKNVHDKTFVHMCRKRARTLARSRFERGPAWSVLRTKELPQNCYEQKTIAKCPKTLRTTFSCTCSVKALELSPEAVSSADLPEVFSRPKNHPKTVSSQKSIAKCQKTSTTTFSCTGAVKGLELSPGAVSSTALPEVFSGPKNHPRTVSNRKPSRNVQKRGRQHFRAQVP